jgi:large subunit ribosomal protein L2
MYDPFRTGFISLNFDFSTQTFFFTSSTELVKPGSFIVSRDTLKALNLGYRSSLKSIPPGSSVHDLALKTDLYAKYSRSAGSSCQILQRIYDTCKVRLPSGLIISTKVSAFATLGRVSNTTHNQTVIGKAGGNRLRGIRPTTRGRAMNAVDHPHGGQTNGGTTPVTP